MCDFLKTNLNQMRLVFLFCINQESKILINLKIINYAIKTIRKKESQD